MTQRKRLRNIYDCMVTRCCNQNAKSFKHYGARGITVCDEWKENYRAFEEWALANGYREDLTIDRKDTYGPYSPENCRWATLKEQGRNRRYNHIITYQGETKTLAEWAEDLGMLYQTLSRRLQRGWDIERAFEQPVKKRRNAKDEDICRNGGGGCKPARQRTRRGEIPSVGGVSKIAV